MSCTNCNPNCFMLVDDSCIPISFTNEKYNIEAGKDSLKTALKKIIENSPEIIESIGEEVEFISTGVKRSVDYEVTIKVNSATTQLEYDLSKVENLCDSANYTVDVFDKSGNRIGSSSLSMGTFNFNISQFPIKLDVKASCKNETDTLVLTSSVQLLGETRTSIQTLLEKNEKQQVLKKQSDVNSFLDQKIDKVYSKLKSFLEAELNGKKGLSNIVNDLQGQITTNKNSSNDSTAITVSCSDKSLSTLLCEHKTKLATIEANLLTKATQISNLEKEIENLKLILLT